MWFKAADNVWVNGEHIVSVEVHAGKLIALLTTGKSVALKGDQPPLDDVAMYSVVISE